MCASWDFQVYWFDFSEINCLHCLFQAIGEMHMGEWDNSISKHFTIFFSVLSHLCNVSTGEKYNSSTQNKKKRNPYVSNFFQL